MKQHDISHGNTLIALNKWAAITGITPITAWRWRSRGMLETVNIAGRVYITQSESERFTARAAAGEFAKVHRAPQKVAA